MARGCVNEPDSFCYVCRELALQKNRCAFTPFIKTAYHMYFGSRTGDQDKKWASCCTRCFKNLRAWMKGTRKSMPFAVVMIWREPKDHINDCHFCITKIKVQKVKNLDSAMRPVSHNDKLPMPKPPDNEEIEMESDEAESSSTSSDINYAPDLNK